MSIFDNLDERLAQWTERRVAGQHDEQCEQRERSYICHCSKRAREARGLTVTPDSDLYFPPPDCPSCDGELDCDAGDSWSCPHCRISWDIDGRASTAYFEDEFGDFDGEQFGPLLRDLARADS